MKGSSQQQHQQKKKSSSSSAAALRWSHMYTKLIHSLMENGKITAQTTPSFIFQSEDPVFRELKIFRHSANFANNLRKAKASYELSLRPSSSSSNKPQTAEASSSSSSKDHTSPNREVTFADEKEAGERLKLDYVDRNINRRRKNALIIEK